MGDFKVVAENSEAEIKKREAEEAIEWPMRELAGNLLRIIRGAGSAANLIPQMYAVLSTAQKYQEAFGHWPSPRTLESILALQPKSSEWRAKLRTGNLSQAAWNRWDEDGTLDRMDAEHKIRRGVLQFCASELVQQTTQSRVGDNEMNDGIRALNDIRRKRQKATRPKTVATPKTVRKPKAKSSGA